ncbi:MAG: hypothetical protein OK457_08560, partial [Thaumarchaeota archaeon]|nr:hypothetical protein [Nitrososphaerota archaeon]
MRRLRALIVLIVGVLIGILVLLDYSYNIGTHSTSSIETTSSVFTSSNVQTVSSTSCTETSTSANSYQTNGESLGYFAEINYSGRWSGIIRGYNSGDPQSLPIVVECFAGVGNFRTSLIIPNPTLQDMVCVIAQKLDAS